MDPNTNQFQIAVSILFVTYVIFETPSNLILKRMKPARYLAGLMFMWGLVATFSAFVTNFAGLVACRLLLGMFEAGLFPGVILYLSMFYNRRNVSLRQAWFYGTSALAGGLGVSAACSYPMNETNRRRVSLRTLSVKWMAWVVGMDGKNCPCTNCM
jgi:MFS family permease